MHRIKCPFCGERDEAEFVYQGDASVSHPPLDASTDEFYRYVYVRNNPKGWHREWWHHVGGCRMWVQVARNTLTHEIYATAQPFERLDFPDGA